MKPKLQRVSLAFARASTAVLLETSGAVKTNLYENTSDFPEPPVTAETLEGREQALMEAIAAQAQSGTAATVTKDLRQTELVNVLRELAHYVQGLCSTDLAKLLSSGFKAVNTNTSSTQLPKPTGLRMKNGISGQSIAAVDTIANARCFEANYALLDDEGKPGEWQSGGLHTASRAMAVGNLIPGRLYLFQVRAIGGSTGYSDWSDSVIHRVM